MRAFAPPSAVKSWQSRLPSRDASGSPRAADRPPERSPPTVPRHLAKDRPVLSTELEYGVALRAMLGVIQAVAAVAFVGVMVLVSFPPGASKREHAAHTARVQPLPPAPTPAKAAAD
jgi:hypothetical protein